MSIRASTVFVASLNSGDIGRISGLFEERKIKAAGVLHAKEGSPGGRILLPLQKDEEEH